MSANAQAIKGGHALADSTLSIVSYHKMENKFFTWEQFKTDFGKELVSAAQVYERRKKNSIKDYALATYDFVFISDSKNKLDSLGKFLAANYGYKINAVKKKKYIGS